jgi:hypothetical protein
MNNRFADLDGASRNFSGNTTDISPGSSSVELTACASGNRRRGGEGGGANGQPATDYLLTRDCHKS